MKTYLAIAALVVLAAQAYAAHHEGGHAEAPKDERGTMHEGGHVSGTTPVSGTTTH